MNAKKINALAYQIADRLFTGRDGRVASRLVLEHEDGNRITTGGGWCQAAVVDVVRDAIIDAVIQDLKQQETEDG